MSISGAMASVHAHCAPLVSIARRMTCCSPVDHHFGAGVTVESPSRGVPLHAAFAHAQARGAVVDRDRELRAEVPELAGVGDRDEARVARARPGGMSTYISPRSSRTALAEITSNCEPGATRRLPPPRSAEQRGATRLEALAGTQFRADVDRDVAPQRVQFHDARRLRRAPARQRLARRCADRAPGSSRRQPAASTATEAAAANGIQRRRAAVRRCARHSASVARRMRASASGDSACTRRLSRSTRSSSASAADSRRSLIVRHRSSARGGRASACAAIRRGTPGAREPAAIRRRFPIPAAPARSPGTVSSSPKRSSRMRA